MRIFIPTILILGAFTLSAQENLDQYLLTDSLEIQALITEEPDQGNDKKTKVAIFTTYGLSVRSISQLTDLNVALEDLGYASIPENSLGWAFGNRIDIGDHLSLGFSYISNYFISGFNAGGLGSSNLSYFDFMIDLGYRYEFASLVVSPEMGIGFNQTNLSLKPNGIEEMSWSELHQNNDLATVLNQARLSVSTGLGVSRMIPWFKNSSKLLSVRSGVIYHPLSLSKLGITSSEWSFVKITDAPSFSSSGFYFIMTLGSRAGKD